MSLGNPLTAREFCALPDPPQAPELLGPLVRRGSRVTIGGPTGHGKTTLADAIAAAIAERGEFLDWRGAGGDVLILDAEQAVRTGKRRLLEAGLAESERVFYVRAPDGLQLEARQEDIEALEAVLASRQWAAVIADPIYKLHRGDSNDERHVTDLMRRFDEWRERFGFAFITPVHVRKRLQGASPKLTIDDIHGSGAYTRGAEVVLGLQRVRPGYSRLYFFKDREGDLPQGEAWGLLFDVDRGFRRDPHDGDRDTAPDKIRELVEGEPGITTEELQSASGYGERTVRDALKAIGAEGAGRPKRWALPVNGDQPELVP